MPRQHSFREKDGEPTYLMMYVMVVCVIPAYHLEWVEGQAVSTMIVDSLASAERKEENGLSHSKTSEALCNDCTQAVQQEALEGMVV